MFNRNWDFFQLPRAVPEMQCVHGPFDVLVIYLCAVIYRSPLQEQIKWRSLSSESESGFSDRSSGSSQGKARDTRHRRFNRRAREERIHNYIHTGRKQGWNDRAEMCPHILLSELKSFTCYPSRHADVTTRNFLYQFEREEDLLRIPPTRFLEILPFVLKESSTLLVPIKCSSI